MDTVILDSLILCYQETPSSYIHEVARISRRYTDAGTMLHFELIAIPSVLTGLQFAIAPVSRGLVYDEDQEIFVPDIEIVFNGPVWEM